MAFRVAASRPYAAEVQRVTSEQVALKEEAQSVRERKAALEEAMRQERTQRLQYAAQRKQPSTSQPRSEVPHDGAPEKRQEDSVPPPSASRNHSAAPHTPTNLDEYRRELDSANGNKEVYRLHYYTSGHINPADVHFYKAKGRVRDYQRHAPSPPRLPSPPRRPARHEEDAAEVLALMPPPGESTAEQWTKSALLRMQANQRTLKRIQTRERREAAFAAARGGVRATSKQRRTQELVEPVRRDSVPHEAHPATEKRHPFVAAATPAAAVATAPVAPSATGAHPWRSDRTAAMPAVTLPWSPPKRQSPPRSYFASSPLRRFSDDPTPVRHSPFKPSLTYSSASLHTSRVEPGNPITPSLDRRATSPWRPLLDSWTSPSQHAYQPIAPQSTSATATSSTPWASRRAWEGITQRATPPKTYTGDRASLFAKPRDEDARVPVKESAGLDVSPLTPSPAMKTAPRSGGSDSGAGAVTAVHPTTAQQRPSLLAGFRMPDTLLKREDLFQGAA